MIEAILQQTASKTPGSRLSRRNLDRYEDKKWLD